LAMGVSTASAMVDRALAMIVIPSVPIMVLRAEMPIITSIMFLVMAVIIVPVIMDFLSRIFAESVRDVAVVDRYPWSVVIGRGIPDVSAVEIVAAADIKEIVWHSHCNIETELWWSDKFRGGHNYHGWSSIGGCADIDAHVDSDLGRIGLGDRNQKSNSQTEQILFHTLLLSGLLSVFCFPDRFRSVFV
jgi:hypothetical protein